MVRGSPTFWDTKPCYGRKCFAYFGGHSTIMVKLAVTLLCALAAPASAFISGGASAGLGLRASGNALFSQQRMPASWRRNVPIVSMSGVEEKKDTSDSGIGWDSHKVACLIIKTNYDALQVGP